MRVYEIAPLISKNKQSMVIALKNYVRSEVLRNECEDFLDATYDRDEHFFLKRDATIYWGKVIWGAFQSYQRELLKLEVECFERTFGCAVKPVIFYQQMGEGSQDSGCDSEMIEVRFFVSQNANEEILVLDGLKSRLEFIKEKEGEPITEDCLKGALSAASVQDFRFSKASQITREELADLMELSFELKKPFGV